MKRAGIAAIFRARAVEKVSIVSSEKPVACPNAPAYIPRSVSGKRALPKRAQAAPAFFIGSGIYRNRHPVGVRLQM